MVEWNNFDTLNAYSALKDTKKVNLVEAMSGENGANRVKNYNVPMAAGLSYNYASKQVDDDIIEKLEALAQEASLVDKFEELYNGAVINSLSINSNRIGTFT